MQASNTGKILSHLPRFRQLSKPSARQEKSLLEQDYLIQEAMFLPKLSQRTVVVTGASRGIGRAVAVKMAQAGARVFAVARTKGDLQALAAEAKDSNWPGTIEAVTADVTRGEEVERFVHSIEAQAGTIDILVNNAGVGHYAALEELSEEQWDAMLDVNLKGAFLCSRAVLPGMKKRRDGQIINIASVAGITVFPGGGGYSASKWGLVGLTETLREELKPFEVRASVICPGSVQTDFGGTPPKDYSLRPEDVADIVLYVAAAPRRVIFGQIVMRPLVPAP